MSTNSKLRELSNQLPPLPKLNKAGDIITYQNTKKMLGKDLLAKNPDAFIEDKKGNKIPLQPHLFYEQINELPVLRNHFNDMKEIFRNDGADGVNRYIKLCFDYNQLINPGLKF